MPNTWEFRLQDIYEYQSVYFYLSIYLSIYLHATILIPGLAADCAVRTSLGLRLALRCALFARQAKMNAIGNPIALRLAFFRPTWLVGALSGRSRHAPGLDFRGRNEGFLDVCGFGYARFCKTS